MVTDANKHRSGSSAASPCQASRCRRSFVTRLRGRRTPPVPRATFSDKSAQHKSGENHSAKRKGQFKATTDPSRQQEVGQRHIHRGESHRDTQQLTLVSLCSAQPTYAVRAMPIRPTPVVRANTTPVSRVALAPGGENRRGRERLRFVSLAWKARRALIPATENS